MAEADFIRAREDRAIYRALKILEGRLHEHGEALSSARATRNFLQLRLADEDREIFMVLFLDAQNKLISAEAMFYGTLTQTSVYPREVVKKALSHNAASVILAHNHPSGVADPSAADEALTRVLKHALALVDVRVLDHVIVGGTSIMSFAERGMM